MTQGSSHALSRTRRALLATALAVCLAVGAGCGFIADKDLIKIARIGDTYITRGDLDKAIRKMPASERPNIQTPGDVLKALEDYIDRQLKEAEGKRLEKAGKIHVPRERAAMIYDSKFPEAAARVNNPDAFELTESDVKFYRDLREKGIDREHERLLGQSAIAHLAAQAMADGVLSISDEEYQEEYDIRKFSLLKYEEVVIDGLYYAAENPEATALAAETVRRLHGGETVDAIEADMKDKGVGRVKTRIIKDPQLADRFGAFWQQASGCEEGAVVGPVFIRGWVKQEMSLQGRPVAQQMPDSYLVCRITDHTPETQKTLEEAKPDLQIPILITKMMVRLREKNGVEIYEDNLPNPGMYDTRSVFDQGP